MQLSEHFSLAEMTTTSQPFSNVPTLEQIATMRLLCAKILEPWRELAGGPFKVDSGFRSPAVNGAVGGSSSSQHLRGEAADVIPMGEGGRTAAWSRLLASIIPVDQAIIYENKPHVHVSWTNRYTPRGQFLVCDAHGRYVPWTSYRGVLRPLP